MKNPSKTKLIPLIFSGLVLLGFTIFIVRNIEKYQELFSFSFLNLFILIVVICTFIILNGIINYLLYDGLSIRLKFKTSLGLAVINTMANLLPFAGGLVAKGIYLNKKHNLEYTKYTSSIGALFICFIATNGFVGLIVLLLMYIFQSQDIPILLIAGFGLMTVSAALLWIPLNISFLPGKIKTQLDSFTDGWQVFRNNKNLLSKLILIQILSVIISALRFWIGFRFLSLEISFLEGLLFASATILTRLISFAPGGLGVREGIIALIGNFIGYDPAVSALAVGIDRIVSTTVILVLGIYFSFDLSSDVLD